MEVTILAVFIAALITAIATGLGALPFVFVSKITDRWLGISNAFAAGLMLAACHSLIVEASEYSVLRTGIGMLTGLGLIVLSNYLISGSDVSIEHLKGADAKKTLLIMGVMTLHSFAEGIGVGVSYGGSETLGVFITSAIAIHNIPEGLAISLVMIPRGISVFKSGWYSVLSSLPQPLMAVPAFLFVLTFKPFLPVGLGLAAGAMLWMIFSELINDALEHISETNVGVVVTISFTLMYAFQHLILE